MATLSERRADARDKERDQIEIARLTRERGQIRFDIDVAMTAIKDGDAAAAYQALEIALSRNTEKETG